MKHLLGSLFAIGVAGVAAIAATSAFLNALMNIGPATGTAANPPGQSVPAPADKTAAPEAGVGGVKARHDVHHLRLSEGPHI